MADQEKMEVKKGETIRQPDPSEKNSSLESNTSDGVYEDAVSLEYTLDDIGLGEDNSDDVYSDCVSTVLESPVSDVDKGGEKEISESVDNNNKKNDEGSKPVYFELEKVEVTSDQDVEITNVEMRHKNGRGDSYIGFTENIEPDSAAASTEDPFENFGDVENSVPVYIRAKSFTNMQALDTVAEDEGDSVYVDDSELGTFDPIYDVVPARETTPSRDSAKSDQTYLSLSEDPIYEVVPARETSQGRPKSKGQTNHTSQPDLGPIGQGHMRSKVKPKSGLGSVYSMAQESNLPPKHGITSSMYEMAKPLQDTSNVSSVDRDFMIESHPPRYPSCKQGVGRPVSVHFLDRAEEARKSLRVVPGRSLDDSDYDKLRFKKLNSKKEKSRSQFYITTPMEEDEEQYKQYELEKHQAEVEAVENEPTTDRLYESISTSNLSDDGWGSSEFEDSDDDDVLGEAPNKPLPPAPRQNKFSDDLVAGGQKFIGRFKRKDDVDVDDDTRCFPVDLNLSKHPPPELPPPPDGLSEAQKKRRCVVELTISSEKSYIDSLERITEDYEKVILENVGGARSSVRVVFKEAHQLLSHHKMFQIEMAEIARRWDEEEKIGDIFTASFSKTMLIDAYSTYVNSFAAAMEEIKSVQRTKQTFADILRSKEKSSSDRLSIFGLMVKPVQRFPQFIMLLQDLLKYTPQDHHDRGALQLALTELENFTHKLNERKRYSEQQFAAKQISSQLLRPPNQVLVRTGLGPKRLIRQDDLEQVVGETGNLKSKKIRIFLMNDCIMCVKVGVKDQGGFKTERYKLKWTTNIRDMELKDSAITPDMESVIKGGPGKLSIYSTQIDKPEEDPFHLFADLNGMLHDYPILAQICGLIQSLKREYYGLTEELIHEHTRDLQRLIQIKDEQLRLVNSCSIILSDISKPERTRYVFQTPTPIVKHDWCMDFLIARLAIDKQNNPAWDGSVSGDQDLPPAFFMKCVPVDVPRHYTKMKCAIPVFLSSGTGARLGLQHLWVVTTTPTRGQISIISIHNSRPSLTESFKATDIEITCTEHVPGFAEEESENAFAEDTVWLATIENEILVFPLASGDGIKRESIKQFSVPAAPISMKYIDDMMFCGLVSGQLVVFARDEKGEWNLSKPTVMDVGKTVLSCMKLIEDNLWIALASKILVLNIDTLKEETTLDLATESDGQIIEEFVTSGVGIWVSFKGSSKLRLYHRETLENLQEINVASSIYRLLEERKGQTATTSQSEASTECIVTSLSASKGLLWIGTNQGFVLTLPLPRLKDGVPLASGRPKLSLHSHRGPVKFLLPIFYSSSVAELNRNNSLWSSLRRQKANQNRGDRNSGAYGTLPNESPKSGDNQTPGENLEGVTSPEQDKTATGTSQTEIWQAEIEKCENTQQDDKNEQKEDNVSEKTGNKTERKSSHGNIQGAKTLGAVRKKKSLKESESFKRNKPKRMNSKSKTLSFRSELANKIAKRNFESSESDYSDSEDDVRLLYENLLEVEEKGKIEEDNFTDAISSFEELPQIGSPENALSARKDDVAKWDKTVKLPGMASMPRQSTTQRGASPAKMSTMKKNTCNAVIMVCGGDGYCDWNKSKQRHNEDASLLLWIYKL